MKFSALCLCVALLASAVIPARSQTASDRFAAAPNMDSLLVHIAATLDSAQHQNTELVSPKHYSRARDAYDEARALRTRNREEDLVRIKLKLAAEELEAMQKAADTANERFEPIFTSRDAALEVHADSLSSSLWRKAEERFRGLLRDTEANQASSARIRLDDYVGSYRSARRDALRNSVLKDAREKIAAAEHRGSLKYVPTLMLRAQQAMSRAEADLAQENIEAATKDGLTATLAASHALILCEQIQRAEKTRQPFESATLPYDDSFDAIVTHLGGSIDWARGPATIGQQVNHLIDSRQDSLLSLTTQQQQTVASLEASLADAQNHLSGAQARIAELERRISTVEGQRVSERTALESKATNAERMARAGTYFKTGEAEIFDSPDGKITIRVLATLFGAGATTLDKTHQKIIDRAAEAVKQFPGAQILVEGNTDSVGTAKGLQKLSEDRALAVATYLAEKLGIPATQASYAGYGLAKPIAPNSTAEGRTRNRRLDIVLSFPH
jgi:OmpA-OmpF porin, OOP family